MKITKILFLIILLLTLYVVHSHGSHGHGKKKKNHNHNHTHHHDHTHHHNHKNNKNSNSNIPFNFKDLKFNSFEEIQSSLSYLFSHYNRLITSYLNEKLKDLSKKEQAYVGALITSTAPFPIFFLIILFNVKNVKLLDIMSAFASGALLGDVLLHNLPEIFEAESHSDNNLNKSLLSEFLGFFRQKEALICLGVITLFSIEKIIALLLKSDQSKKVNQNDNHDHSHDHHGHTHFSESRKNVIISLIGDCVHNITDGLAIGAAYSKSLKLGITLTISIFFHEIPHEVGDFSYLLKQKLSKLSALSTQIFSALGCFLGVYLSKNQI